MTSEFLNLSQFFEITKTRLLRSELSEDRFKLL